MTVKWKEPPVRGPGVWEARLLPLMERPGKWAVVYETETAVQAHNIRQQLTAGRYALPETEGEWEFKARKSDSGGEVYARYLDSKETADHRATPPQLEVTS